MDRTFSARAFALLLPLGAMPMVGCGSAADHAVPTAAAHDGRWQNVARRLPDVPSKGQACHEPLPLPAPASVRPLESDISRTAIARSPAIHLTSETGPELTSPVELPAEDSTWNRNTPETNELPVEEVNDSSLAPLEVAPATSPFVEEASPPIQQSALPWAQPAPETPELQAIVADADRIVRRGFDLAGRGATYSARTEFIAALRRLAETLDATAGVAYHCQALAAGLTALKESEDFEQRSIDQPLDVAAIVQAHRTPILKHDSLRLSSSAASQRYFSYAQEQLAVAVEGKRPGSLALYGLGRLLVGGRSNSVRSVHVSARAITYFQAALLVDDKNHLAANELGVLLVQVGRFEQARMMFEQSLSAAPHAEAWHNLSIVHARLGQADPAAKAEQNAQSLTGRSNIKGHGVRWLDPENFARVAPTSELVPPLQPAATASTQSKPTVTKRSAWRWPNLNHSGTGARR